MEFTSVSISTGQIKSSEGLPIRYDLYAPQGANSHPLPVVLFVHGFKGFKDWGIWPDACEEMARNGLVVCSFNLSRNGIGENKYEFDRLDLFEKQTLSQDLDDIGRVIDALQNGEISDEHAHMNTDLIGILGHSRGGHTAIAAGVEYDDVQAVVTWNAVADYLERWTDEMVNDWKTKGHTYITNSRTGQKMKLDKVVYEDSLNNADRVIAIRRVEDLRIPTLFIASREDESVPYTDSEKLHIACPAHDKELRLLTHGGHTLGASHPYDAPEFPKPFGEALESTSGWFREYLK
jgi:dienelactone hydrolase